MDVIVAELSTSIKSKKKKEFIIDSLHNYGPEVGLVAFAAGQQQNYLDFDYQTQGLVRAAPVGRTAQVKPTPVPIIKQINRHNDDGSYTYGYEGADGSFKIETKLPTGEVSGKYGYVDDTGKLRVVDYGANRYGFQPAGDGITVAPPTLVDETTDKTKEGGFADYEEGAIYARPQLQNVAKPIGQTLARQQKRPRPAQIRPIQYVPEQPQYVSYEAPAAPRTSSPAPTPIPVHHFQVLQQAPAQFPQQVQPSFQHPQQLSPAYFSVEQQRPVAPVAPTPAPSAPSGPLFRPHSLPAPVAASPRPAAVREHHDRNSGSVLDSLIQQYALPQGVGQPLHDISFGSYSSQTNF
ncbi:hypothetical protein RUM43_014768 [Polyplax serrata]|uniref:Uncharacterized protein n=1 Tax=Polyplax serrata TaxID=468196 RepID=A0AAN8PFW8_POLSC